METGVTLFLEEKFQRGLIAVSSVGYIHFIFLYLEFRSSPSAHPCVPTGPQVTMEFGLHIILSFCIWHLDLHLQASAHPCVPTVDPTGPQVTMEFGLHILNIVVHFILFLFSTYQHSAHQNVLEVPPVQTAHFHTPPSTLWPSHCRLLCGHWPSQFPFPYFA